MMEKKEERPADPGVVFTTAQLVWQDEETGEVLEIEVVGAAPWVWELAEQGFTTTQTGEPHLRRYRCRIELSPDPG